MAKLEYTFKHDTLFKLLFVSYPDLLKRLVSELLSIHPDSIGQFEITNTDMPPEVMGDKFCRLDINMMVDGKLVDLEIQVADEGDYPERSLYYWAREYSTALKEGGKYKELPQTIIISIVAFEMFDSTEFHSEFQPLEVTRHTLLTDRMCLHYFELPKLPEVENADDELKLWLALFNAETEEDLEKIEGMGVSVMNEAIGAYRHVTTTDAFRELERQRHYAAHNRASALAHAAEVEREKWREVVVEKDTALAEKDTALAEKDTALAEKDTALAKKDTVLAEKDAIIAELLSRLGESHE